MKKTIVYLAFCALALGAGARTLTPDEALARTAQSGVRKAPSRSGKTPRLVHTELTATGEPAVYVFNNDGRNDGYMVLSADDAAYPVLGYSDSGSFDTAGMPDAMKWWLSEYAAQLEYVKSKGIDPTSLRPAPRRADRTPIAPQIKTDWDQGEPYNQQCPTYGGVPTYTGCVATAMAQVMKYWNYPERGEGSIQYNATTLDKRLAMNFSRRPFDWDNMLPKYVKGAYNDTQADAVAYLMKACGYSVKMDYGTESSGALAMNIANALVKYFNYDGNIDYQLRQYYSSSQWEEMLYNNLKEVGPIMYGGGSRIGGGHSFICDGYSEDGYFHFNWGWTGMSNGYFLLDALNPYALGAGGGQGGGYNFTQDAVLGIQPPTGKPVQEKEIYLTQCGSLAGEMSDDGILYFILFAEGTPMWVNYNPQSMHVKFGVRITPQGDTPGDVTFAEISDRRFEIDPGYGTGSPNEFIASLRPETLGLADGTYKMEIVTSDPELETDRWIDVRANYNNYSYIYLTKKGSEYSVEVPDAFRLEVVDGGPVGGELYYGCNHRMEVTVRNMSDMELSSGLAPFVIIEYDTQVEVTDEDGNVAVQDTTLLVPYMLGESVLVTLQPGQEVTRTWDTDLYILANVSITKDTKAYLTFYDEGTDNYYLDDIAKPMILHPNPGVPYLETVWAPRVIGAPSKFEKVDGQRVVVYELEDASSFDVNCTLELKRGYCAYNVYACIAAPDQDDPNQIALLNYSGAPMHLPTVGDRDELTTTLNLPDAVPGQLYTIMMAYAYGQTMVQVGPKFGYFRVKGDPSGVDDITAETAGSSLVFDGESVKAADDAAQIEVFNTAGVCVATGRGSVTLRALPAGAYIARSGADTLKIMK